MPAFRSKMRCIGYATEPAPKKPRVKKVLTDAEKDEAAVKRDVNKLLRENKKEWESTLKPWVGSESTRWPVGTLAMYKSDAKKAFSLTEAELLTLPHESIASSPKSFFALDAIKALARKKHTAGALLLDPVDEAMHGATVWKKTQDNGWRNKGNWSVLEEWQIPGTRMYRYMEVMKAKRESELKAAGKSS